MNNDIKTRIEEYNKFKEFVNLKVCQYLNIDPIETNFYFDFDGDNIFCSEWRYVHNVGMELNKEVVPVSCLE